MPEDHNTSSRIAFASIEHRLRKNGHDGIFLESRPDRGAGTDEWIRIAAAAVAQANEALPADTVWGESVSASPAGWLVKLDSIGTRQQTLAWLSSFAGYLDTAGYPGEIAPARQVWLPSWLQDNRVPRMTAHLAYRLSKPFVRGNVDTRGPAGWNVESETTEALCEDAVSWAAFPGGALLFSEGRSQLLMQRDDVAEHLARAVRRTAAAGVTCVRKSPLLVRRVQLSAWGQLTCQLEAPDQTWHARLDELRAHLVKHADRLDLAVIRLSANWAVDWTDLAGSTPPLPYVSEGQVRNNRQLWDQHTPDAYGLQVLTEQHLARVDNLDGWEVSAVAPGRFLVQARDLAAWYAGTEPEPGVLDRARRDFGAAIFTPEAVAARS